MADVQPIKDEGEKPAAHEAAKTNIDVVSLLKHDNTSASTVGEKNTAQLHPVSIGGEQAGASKVGDNSLKQANQANAPAERNDQLHPLTIEGQDSKPDTPKPGDTKSDPQKGQESTSGPRKTGDTLIDTGGGTYIDANDGHFIPSTIDEGGGFKYDTSTGQTIHQDN